MIRTTEPTDKFLENLFGIIIYAFMNGMLVSFIVSLIPICYIMFELHFAILVSLLLTIIIILYVEYIVKQIRERLYTIALKSLKEDD